jgi:hypothetical protein
MNRTDLSTFDLTSNAPELKPPDDFNPKPVRNISEADPFSNQVYFVPKWFKKHQNTICIILKMVSNPPVNLSTAQTVLVEPAILPPPIW